MEKEQKLELEKIIEWLKSADFTKFSDDDLIALFEILEPYQDNPDIAEIIEKLRNELKRRNVKRRVWVPRTPTKKGCWKEVDY